MLDRSVRLGRAKQDRDVSERVPKNDQLAMSDNSTIVTS